MIFKVNMEFLFTFSRCIENPFKNNVIDILEFSKNSSLKICQFGI